jgi:Xaa-Pro aminopeptidase
MSGENSGRAFGAFARSTHKRVERGELILTHCNSYVNGYWTDITRTYVLGEAGERERIMFRAISEAHHAALAAIAPGVLARDVDRAARETLSAHGFGPQFKHSTGHGVGFAAIDANAYPRIHPKSDDRLEPGMVFNIEPGIYFPGHGGMRHCDMVAVTESGVELLTPFQPVEAQT